MFKSWFGRNKSLIITTMSGVVVAAVVAVTAIVSTGYTAQQLNLNDSSVWVANGSKQAIGRANTTVRTLNSVVQSTGTDIDVVQDDSTTLLVDNANSKLEVVDPATSTVTQSVPLPPGKPTVYLTPANVVIVSQDTGQVWLTPIGDIGSFDSQAPAALTLGAGTVASVDPNGLTFIYSPSQNEVYRIQPDLGSSVESTSHLVLSAKDQLSVTSVAGHWAVLDSTTSRLYVQGGGSTRLDSTVAATAPALQQASAEGSGFLVAGTDGLASVALDASSITTMTDNTSGTPARPLVVGGCEYSAWSGGMAWRRCAKDTSEGTTLTLAGIRPTSNLVLRANGSRVVLNDSHSGATWAVQSTGQLINNWAALIVPKKDQTDEDHDEDTPPQEEKQQLPPVAVNDTFGARPARASVLPVLLNDYDPNGDVLAITDVTPISDKIGHIDLINQAQQLQLTLTPSASGTITFRYTISDGRGGSASATVTVTVRSQSENSAPKQVRTSKSLVVEGGRVSTQVLGDWVDPDGDPMYVTNATVASPDAVSFTPDGTIVFSDAGKSSGLKSVAVTVSDGRTTGTGTLAITVRAAGKVPIIADPFIVIATAGQPLTISPLAHDRGGSAPLRLNSVPARAGVTLTPSYDAGTFQFESTQVGTHYLDYVVTDGADSVTGAVRVDVVAPPESNTKPITIPKTVFVRALSASTVDIADSDIDPSGGVLLVTGISGMPDNSGVTTEILQQRSIRVTLTKPIDAPVTFDYTVTNGLSEADGTVTVIQIPTPARLQPPVANDDSITVRTGAAVDIPVLDNDQDPDGEDLTLVPTLVQNLPEGAGLLFASGSVLRYLAPDRPGNYSAVYAVAGPDGQTARAQVKIAVREPDVSSNNPPVPVALTARAIAGGSVTINVPLSGIDPDGDTVQLLGLETNPEKGSVTAVGQHSITYKAGDYSAGTDSFTYSVIDALGARATGTVRVGIAARTGGDSNPVATLDDVRVRPGVTVSVQVLANDSDPNGGPLHVVSAVPNDKVTKARVVDNIVSIRPPDATGTYGVVYTIANDTGGTSSAFVRVTVDPKAPLSFPVANDTVLSLTDVLDRTTVDVNVLANVFFADGPSSDLGLSVYPGYGSTAQVTARKHIKVTVTAKSQIIPFKVTHPDDPNVFSYAFIWVPGSDDALPQLNRNAQALAVKSGTRLLINLNDYVIAVGGKKVQLTDSSTVRATHADGSSLVVDDRTLAFTSAPRYFGPASISFEVTDGTSASDPDGRKSILVLPITVLPSDNQPPVFSGGLIDLEPSEHIVVDLVKLTNYPYQADLPQLDYTVNSPLPRGVIANLTGQRLTISANDDATIGSTSQINIGVRDSTSTGTPGRIAVAIVPSTRPLAVPAPDVANVKRGASTTIDVLANDNATNPFPATPLKVIAIRGIGGGSLPDGVSVTPSDDNSRLSVSVASTVTPGDITFQYEVEDATKDPSRYVWGNVKIAVQDRPDPVTNVHVTDFGDKRLTVAWTNGAANNSPITGYTVSESDGTTGNPVLSVDCSGSLCSVPTPGNGPSNSVRLAVVAKNAVGTSDPASGGSAVWSDVVPAAPSNLDSSPLDHGLTITWAKPADNGGSAITKYVVSVDGTSSQEVSVDPGDPVGKTYSKTITDPAIANGSSVGYSVSARNSALSTLANWNKASGTGHPAGSPIRTGTPTAASPVGSHSAVVNWDGDFSSNGRDISNYYASISTGSDPVSCGVTGSLPGSPDVPGTSSTFKSLLTGTSTTFGGLSTNTPYTVYVYAFNGMGCTTSASTIVTPRVLPGPVSSIVSSGPNANGTNTWDYQIDDFTIGSGSTDADRFEYRLTGDGVDGEQSSAVNPGTFLATPDASQYGNDVSVQVKACKSYPEQVYCSADWSQAFHLGVPVNNSDLGGQGFTHTDFSTLLNPTLATGTYSWSSSPNGAYSSITYSCGSGDHTMVPGSGGSCDVTETGLASHDFPDLTITVNVGGQHFSRSYSWQSFGQ
jgi:hypothetical protein